MERGQGKVEGVQGKAEWKRSGRKYKVIHDKFFSQGSFRYALHHRFLPFAIFLIFIIILSCRGGGKLSESFKEAQKRHERQKFFKKLINEIPDVLPQPEFDDEIATKLALLPLSCVQKQYPYKPADILEAEEDVQQPVIVHPSFYGCFDWHSSVHAHWTLVKIIKSYPEMKFSSDIREKLFQNLGRDNLLKEAKYFEKKWSDSFERPYGWGWLLRLATELKTMDDTDARVFAKNIEPLEKTILSKFVDYLLKLSYPVRAGTHQNTAFSLTHLWDYASLSKDDRIILLLKKKGKSFYINDKNCPVSYEPSGEDFISPCLVEADFMRRILSREEFYEWFDRFLPWENAASWRTLAKLPLVLDKKDPTIGHLVGLCFQRAWSMKGIASVLNGDDLQRNFLLKSAWWHEKSGLKLMEGSEYGGEHWLASFAVFSLTSEPVIKEEENHFK